eukprot:gene2266-2708_t
MPVDSVAKMIRFGNVSRPLGGAYKREQPLYAVVTGMGRGKTRFLVELQRELNSNPLDVPHLDSAVFCVAITFNNLWDYIYYPYRFSKGSATSEAMEMVYAVNIVARLLSMVFHINYNIAYDIVAPAFSMNVRISDRAGVSQPMALIQECVKYIVSRCPPKGTRKTNHFVLLVDESVSAQEGLGNSFLDIHRVLREALLTYSIELDGEVLKIDLVMSALNLTPLGLKNSNRRVIPLALPEAIDATEIWERWVSHYLPTDFIDAINQCSSFLKTTSSTYVHEMITSFLVILKKAVANKYPNIGADVLPPHVMRAIVFRERIKLDQDIMDFIDTSTLTNTIGSLSLPVNIVPVSNLVSMYVNSMTRDNKIRHIYMDTIKTVCDSLWKSFLNPKANLGEYLAVISSGVTDIRLQALVHIARSGEPETVPVHTLLQISYPLAGASEALNQLLESTLSVARIWSFLSVKLSWTNPPEDHEHRAILDASNEIMWKTTGGEEGIIKLVPTSTECFDSGWLIPQKALSKKPIALFMACKSRAGTTPPTLEAEHGKINAPHLNAHIVMGNEEPRTVGDLPSEQARRFETLVTAARYRDKASKSAKGSLLEALVEGRYLFVYLVTSVDSQSFAVGDNTVVLQGVDAKCYLSFFYDFYRLLREENAASKVF